MPTAADIPHVVVVVTEADPIVGGVRNPPTAQGYVGRELARMVHVVSQHWNSRVSIIFQSPLRLLKLDGLEAQLRASAEAHGLDFDAALDGAAQHFTSPAISRRNAALTPEELESWHDDDRRTLDR